MKKRYRIFSFTLAIVSPLAVVLTSCPSPNGPTSQAQGARVTTYAGTGVAGYSDGPGAQAKFNKPRGVGLDSQGNLWVAEDGSSYGNKAIRKILTTGEVTTGYTPTSNVYPNGNLAVVPSAGLGKAKDDVVWGTDTALRLDDSSYAGYFYGAYISSKITNGIAAGPNGVVYTMLTSGIHLSSDRSTSPADLTLQDAQGKDVTFDGYISGGSGLAADPAADVLYVTNGVQVSKIVVGNTKNVLSVVAGTSGAGGAFTNAQSLAVDGSGRLFVVDAGTNQIKRVDPSGQVTVVAGSGAASTSAVEPDSAPLDAKFDFSDGYTYGAHVGIAVNASGTVIYVAEYAKNRIRKITL